MKRRLAILAAAGFAASTIGAPVSAKTVKLVVVGAPPPLVANVKLTKEYFVPEVTKRLAATGKDFKIEWRQAYAQTLAKFTEVFETVAEGIAHVGVQIPPFEASKLPLEQYSTQIPFGVTDSRVLTNIDAVIHAKVPEIMSAWTDNNQIHLGGAAPDCWQIVTRDPLTKVADMKGLKIGTAGPAGEWLRGTGAVRVNTSLASAYTDIRNGVYDGALSSHSLTFPFKVYEAAKYITDVGFSCTIATALSVNLDTWRALPDFARKIFSDVAKEWTIRYTKLTAQQAALFVKLMGKKGAQFSTFPAAEREKWIAGLPNIPKRWIGLMAKRNLPGDKVVSIYMDEARARGTKFVRQWDKE